MIFDIPNKLLREFSDSFTQQQGNMSQSQLRSLLESALQKCQLVTREEFDAQQAVLQRTREKIDALEKQVGELEQQLKDSSADTGSAQ